MTLSEKERRITPLEPGRFYVLSVGDFIHTPVHNDGASPRPLHKPFATLAEARAFLEGYKQGVGNDQSTNR